MFSLRALATRTMFTASSLTSQTGPVETAIRSKLSTILEPVSLTISNDSHQHRHHAAMRTQGDTTESHFSLQIVSEAFAGKNTMQRHRMIYAALSEEFAQGLHSLSLKTKTPSEVASTNSA